MVIPLTAAVALSTAPAASAAQVPSFQKVVQTESNGHWREHRCDHWNWRWDWRCRWDGDHHGHWGGDHHGHWGGH